MPCRIRHLWPPWQVLGMAPGHHHCLPTTDRLDPPKYAAATVVALKARCHTSHHQICLLIRVRERNPIAPPHASAAQANGLGHHHKMIQWRRAHPRWASLASERTHDGAITTPVGGYRPCHSFLSALTWRVKEKCRLGLRGGCTPAPFWSPENNARLSIQDGRLTACWARFGPRRWRKRQPRPLLPSLIGA
jgi:hypothetical protein